MVWGELVHVGCINTGCRCTAFKRFAIGRLCINDIEVSGILLTTSLAFEPMCELARFAMVYSSPLNAAVGRGDADAVTRLAKFPPTWLAGRQEGSAKGPHRRHA